LTTPEKGMLIITLGFSKNDMQIIRSFIFCTYYMDNKINLKVCMEGNDTLNEKASVHKIFLI
jgi:hypothetical protein